MGKYYFDKQLIQDIGVHLTISKQARAPSASFASGYSKENNGKLILKKIHCTKKIPLQNMRSHVGGHS